MQYVYILQCSDGLFYTGCTENIENRLKRHSRGYVEFTNTRLPVALVWWCSFADKTKAFEFEKYLKSGSGIAFRNKHLV
jgi:putative endonuclease